MYFVMIVLLLFVAPIGSIYWDTQYGSYAPLIFLIGKWFVFWAAGVRLFLAGLRQTLQPRFTAEKIFGITDPAPLQVVQELGFSNLSVGALGLITIVMPGWIIPAAVAGGLYYGLAGIKHLMVPRKNSLAAFAMLTDIYAFVVLAFCVARSVIR